MILTKLQILWRVGIFLVVESGGNRLNGGYIYIYIYFNYYYYFLWWNVLINQQARLIHQKSHQKWRKINLGFWPKEWVCIKLSAYTSIQNFCMPFEIWLKKRFWAWKWIFKLRLGFLGHILGSIKLLGSTPYTLY